MLRFLVGLSLGIIAGVVFAPASGEETRRQIVDRAEQMKQRGIEAGRQEAREVGSQVGEHLFDKAVGE